MGDVFNHVEKELWFVANIKPVAGLIWYALGQNFELAARGLACFINQAITLDIIDRNADTDSPANVLLNHLENTETRQATAQRYRTDEVFRLEFHRQIQQVFTAIAPDEAALSVAEVSNNAIAMGRACQTRQQTLLRQAARQIAGKEGAKVILFGHTHHPLQESLPNGGAYINTGSWIENFFDAPLETWETLFEGMHYPGNLLPCLPYARIDYDEDNMPTVQLLYFNKTPQPNAPVTETQTDSSPKGFFEKNLQRLARLLKTGSG